MVKAIYLDQNKWIEIARVRVGKEKNKELEEINELITNKVENNEWVFPLSIIHHFETMARLDDRTRIELAQVMGDISRNYAILPYIYVDGMEFKNSLRRIHGQAEVDFSKEIITQDFVRAAGSDGNNFIIEGIENDEILQRLKSKIKEEMRTRNLFLEMMKSPVNRDKINKDEQDNCYYKKYFEDVRKGICQKPKQFRYDVFIIRNYLEHFKAPLSKYAEMCKRNGIPVENMIPESTFRDKKSTRSFLEAVPSFCIRMRLIYDICNNTDRDIHKNDFKDIAFLATAVPYCDVVVTEKLWTHLLKKNKLDKKYNTVVTNSLADLKNI